MDLLDALRRNSGSAPAQGPGKAERLFDQFLQARNEGDDPQAFEYIKESMELGYLPAIGEYGNMLMLGVTDDEGNTVEEEDQEAKLKLAQLYIMGLGEDQDYDEALRLLDQARRIPLGTR